MLGGVRELVPRSRTTFSIVAPAIAVVVGLGLFVPQPVRARTMAAHRHLAPRASFSPNAYVPSLTPQYLRSLPHGQKATAGRPFFANRPPAKLSAAANGGAAVPAVAVAAYEHAARVLAKTDRACHLSWADLAAIGRVESDNGRTWGSAARVSKNGTLTPPILGPLLDGKHGYPAYPSPDHGRLEQGGKWERAVGPMQFLPSTWREYGQDGNHDGVKNPQNFWDASLATGVYLCSNGGNLATKKGFDAAVLAYNHSRSYLALVGAWARFYAAAGAKRLAAATPSLLAVGISPLTKHQQELLAKRMAARAVALAVADTKRTPAYAVRFSLLGKGKRPLLSGGGRLGTKGGVASLVVRLPGVKPIHLLTIGHAMSSYVSLPVGLTRRLGEKPSAWLSYSAALKSALPARISSDLSLAALAGAPATVLQAFTAAGPTSLRAARYERRHRFYVGRIELATGTGKPVPEPLLSTVAGLAGSRQLRVDTWTTRRGRLARLELFLPELRGASSAPLTFVLELSSTGGSFSAAAPKTVPFPLPTSTTTTTSTTSPPVTSSSTTTTTSTTSPPVTSSSTTTTTSTTSPPVTSSSTTTSTTHAVG